MMNPYWSNDSSRPHEPTDFVFFPQIGGDKVREKIPAVSGKSRLVKYYSIWPESLERGDSQYSVAGP